MGKLSFNRRSWHATKARWWLGGALVMALMAGVAYWQHWYEPLFFHLKERIEGPRQGLRLEGYRVVIEGKAVAGVSRNLSAISYDRERDRLLAVTNDPPVMLELDRQGEVLDRHQLEGFGDIEGIASLGDGRVVVVDERRQRFSVFTMPEPGAAVDQQRIQSLSLGMEEDGNKGFEGISYDAEGDRLFVVKESRPQKLYAIEGFGASLEQGLSLHIRDLTSWIEGLVFNRDLSDVFYHGATGHLLLLSDRSHSLVELDREGRYVSFRAFLRANEDMQRDAPQLEGVTMDDQGDLYLVSEPNLFYRLKKTGS
ncbi:SdiA-regulated domain-containing protein [Alloalcanivorax xenomutans]|uniref:SdiA-regulated domain-containing protein n=1 Tax=Alloalcanivorax xenomutans TaxID=1094342 RepID=UPI0004B947F4